jgi:hypothetical protein
VGCVGGAMTLFALGKCGGLITIDSALDLTIHVAVEVRARNYNLLTGAFPSILQPSSHSNSHTTLFGKIGC